MKLCLFLFLTLFISACIPGVPDFTDVLPESTTDDTTDSNSATEIKDKTFTYTNENCGAYEGSYKATEVTDRNTESVYTSDFTVSFSDDTCTFTSTNTPSHDFNSSSTPFSVGFSTSTVTVNLDNSPSQSVSNTDLLFSYYAGIMLNGVFFDPLVGSCYLSGEVVDTGCTDDNEWKVNPVHDSSDIVIDSNNGTTEHDGTYVYLAQPNAMYAANVISPVIGFAADGFPIYGPWIEREDGSIDKVKSSYAMRTGSRGETSGGNPGGSYDGFYRNDFSYLEGSGDLDECNGMEDSDGNYAYFVTDDFPYTVNCFKGTPDSSFSTN